jgi:putative RecB family exonuclease
LAQEGKETGRRTGGYTRSISQLKSFTRCGEAFYLERFKRSEVPRRPAAWTILGIALHDAVMEWEKSERQIDVLGYFYSKYDALVAEERDKQPDEDYWFLPPNTKTVSSSITNYRKRGADNLSTYISRCREAPWEVSCLEREFEIQLAGITVRGGVDRILFYPSDESYLVEDLKSGSPKDEEDIRQLAFYAFVARELWDIPVTEGRYWFTKLDRPSETVNLERFDRRYWEEQFDKLDRSISQELFLPSPGAQCGLCAVKPWCSAMGWLKIGEPLK